VRQDKKRKDCFESRCQKKIERTDMASSESTSSKYDNFFREGGGDEGGGEKIDYEKLLGKMLKEGTITVQDNFEEWVQCRIIIRERGITLAIPTKQENPRHKTSVNAMMDFSSCHQVGIVMLPDNARRSRESKLFPFAVQNKTPKAKRNTALRKRKDITSVVLQGMDRDEVILATSNGRDMWEWASYIQWLGTTPKEEKIPLFPEPDSVTMHNEHYEDSEVLQNVLLKLFTYRNLPQKPISFEDLVRVHIERRYAFLPHAFLYYPDGFFSRDDFNNVTIIDDSTADPHIVNSARTFALFAYIVLVGACVHVNEKCFELITSSNLYDISSQVTWKGNSIFSMLCEGQYNSARNYMVQVLFRLGYPRLEGYCAGHCDDSFSMLIAKPKSLFLGYGVASGQPVHPDDQKLCQHLLEKGDGKSENDKLSNQLIEASKRNATEFESEHNKIITAIVIPKNIMSWGCNFLTKLNVRRNGIFELPEELYHFTGLTHLDISMNCLFGLSHKLVKLTKLEYFNIECNLIEELPYTIENLKHITEFRCRYNPISKPPSAVWSRGIEGVRKFFRDIRESGTEINLDLRVLVLGLSEAGKTSLINGMMHPDAVALTRVGDRTVGIEKRTWIMNRRNNEQPINLLTYDFAGQEEYYITHHLFLGSKALYIIAFDLSKYKPSLIDKQIMLWWDSIQNRVCDVKSHDSKTPKVILVGTHADMLDDAQSCADDIHTSLKQRFQSRMNGLKDRLKKLGEELDDLDPRKGKKGDAADGERMEKEYAMLPSEKKIQILMHEGEVKKLRLRQQCTIALPATIQAVSSKDLHNVDKLKEQIAASLIEVGPSGKYFPHLDVPVPGSWFQVRRFVRQKCAQKGYECMKLPQYFHLLSTELNINEDVGRRATSFCHDLGDVLFFDKEGLIFLQPSFLIDLFKCVIRHDHKESTYWTENLLDHNINEEQFNAGRALLLQEGELQEWLLKVLWSRLYDGSIDTSVINNLIQLLETFDIATSIERQGRKCLLIPEFQPKYLISTWSRHKDDDQYEIQRWISTDQQLPHGLLKRIQVRIFKKVFKRSGTHDFNLAQDEIYILDKNSTMLYCKSGKEKEECSRFGKSEGLRLYIRGKDKHYVMSFLSKVYTCVKDTLNDYPGLIFDHYIVHTTQSGSSLNKLEELEAMQAAGENKICVSIPIPNSLNEVEYEGDMRRESDSETEKVILNIDDLLPPSQTSRML